MNKTIDEEKIVQELDAKQTEKVDFATQSKIITNMCVHRVLVDDILEAAAQDLITRGRVHDNSVSDDTELYLNSKCMNAETLEDRRKFREMADHLHKVRNDHHVEYHENGIRGMNLLQLLEFVADRIAIIDTKCVKSLQSGLEYIDQIPELKECPDLIPIIVSTIDYIKNATNRRTKWIKKYKEVKDGPPEKEPTVRSI